MEVMIPKNYPLGCCDRFENSGLFGGFNYALFCYILFKRRKIKMGQINWTLAYVNVFIAAGILAIMIGIFAIITKKVSK